jgi:ABC-2 type transport system permease protein
MDRDGFRSFVLAPASRRDVLAGKNLSWLLPGLTLLAIMLGVIMAGRGMSAWGIAEALILFGAAFLLMAAAGNFASVLWPLRIASGAAKRSVTPTHVVMQMVFIMAFPIAVAPVFAPALVKLLAAQASADLANLAGVVVAAGVLGFAVVVYVLALGPAARLLERRERSVLETLTREVN